MGRPAGARDASYEARRGRLLERILARLMTREALHASYRDLAQSSGASISTLQHYFGARADVVVAALHEANRRPDSPNCSNPTRKDGVDKDGADGRLAHQKRGEMRRDCQARAGALILLSPLILAYLHQYELGGAAGAPLDMDRFLDQHCEAFVRAHADRGSAATIAQDLALAP